MAEPMHPREQALHDDPQLLASVKRGLEQAASGDLIDVDPFEDPLEGPEWLERPRGHACPECHAHILFGARSEDDRAAHDSWHANLRGIHHTTVQALDGIADILDPHNPASEPKD